MSFHVGIFEKVAQFGKGGEGILIVCVLIRESVKVRGEESPSEMCTLSSGDDDNDSLMGGG